MICLYDFRYIIFNICANSIESIEDFLLALLLFLQESLFLSSHRVWKYHSFFHCQEVSNRLEQEPIVFRCSFTFLIDCVVMKARPSLSLNLRLFSEARPASVQTMKLESSKSEIIFFSNGFNVSCSFMFPRFMLKARGILFPSINRPIWTIGLGLWSLEGPYCLLPSSCSISKK